MGEHWTFRRALAILAELKQGRAWVDPRVQQAVFIIAISQGRRLDRDRRSLQTDLYTSWRLMTVRSVPAEGALLLIQPILRIILKDLLLITALPQLRLRGLLPLRRHPEDPRRLAPVEVELGVLSTLSIMYVPVLALQGMHMHLKVSVLAEHGADVGPLAADAFLEVVVSAGRLIDLG